MASGPVLCVVHADSGAFDDGVTFGVVRCGDEKIVAQQIVAVEMAGDVQGATEQAGAVR